MNSLKYDVIVAGGGLGGTMAAIAAARSGARTLLLEKSVCLGGTATEAMVCEIDGSYKNGHCMLPAIAREMLDRLYQRNAAKKYGEVPMSSNPGIGCDRIRFNPEYMKLVLDEMVQEAGVDIFFMVGIREVTNTGKEVHMTLSSPYEEIKLAGSVLIDATGNSEVLYLMNPEATEKTNQEKRQGVTMIFTLGNVDHEEFMKNLDRETLAEIIQKGQEDGIFPYRIFASCPLPGTNAVSISMTRVADVDVESLNDISRALTEARKQINKAVPYLRKHLKGCENAYLSSIAPALGIRERRRIVGLYELKGEHLVHCEHFPDTVALGCYPVDIHRKNGKYAVQFIPIQGDGIYEIPFRSLVSKDYPNVLAGGKNIFADDIAFAALRTMPSVMGIGNAAGTAAAMAAAAEADLRTMDIAALCNKCKMVDYPDSSEHFE